MTVESDGTLRVTVQNQNGDPAGGASVVFYTTGWDQIATRTADGNGVVSWTHEAGSYNLEAYSNGEFWVYHEDATIAAGQTTNVTMRRNEPYTYDFRVIRTDTGQNVTGSSVPAGTPLRFDLTVRNSSVVSRSVRIANMQVDRSRTSPWDWDVSYFSAYMMPSNSTHTFSIQIPSSIEETDGTYYRRFETHTNINGNWVKTDSWPSWGIAVTVY